MNTWNTNNMASALPEVAAGPSDIAVNGSVASKTPQSHGWSAPVTVDYGKYGMTSAELIEASQKFDEDVANNARVMWEGSAPRYEYQEEYGDVQPRMEQMEQMLFPKKTDLPPALHWDGIMSIKVEQEGPVRIIPVSSFEDAGLHPAMLENVRLCGYANPTPIQQYVLPAVFEGHDMIACSQTGTGKTAAYMVSVLSKLMGKAKKLCAPRSTDGPTRAEPLVLVLSPTRELATQIFNEARRFCYRTSMRPAVIYGGVPVQEAVRQLSMGADLLIATPGRLIDLLSRQNILTLRRLRYMVIDEADEMMEADWEEDFKKIMFGGDQERDNVKYLMFSATFPKPVQELAEKYLDANHVRIRVGRTGSSHGNITQDVVFVEQASKKVAIFDLLLSSPVARTMIFVNSKRAADDLDDFLHNKDMPCMSLHSDRSQLEREDILRAFRMGTTPILIATGLAARGIDIPFIAHVINFDLPSLQHGGIIEYTHRIGRTGRSGQRGHATSFYSEKDSDIASILTKTLCETHQAVPDFLEEFLPEGFTADGKGDVATLKFDADSENNDVEAEAEADAGAVETAGGWGNDTSSGVVDADAAPAWDAPLAADPVVAPVAAPFAAPFAAPIAAPFAAPFAAPIAAPVIESILKPTQRKVTPDGPGVFSGMVHPNVFTNSNGAAAAWENQDTSVPIPALQPKRSPGHVRFNPVPQVWPGHASFAAGAGLDGASGPNEPVTAGGGFNGASGSNVPVATNLTGSPTLPPIRKQAAPVLAPVVAAVASTPTSAGWGAATTVIWGAEAESKKWGANNNKW